MERRAVLGHLHPRLHRRRAVRCSTAVAALLIGIHRYDVFYQQDLAVCFTHAINTTLPKPDLTALNYIGKAVIGQEPVYHWYIQVASQVRSRLARPRKEMSGSFLFLSFRFLGLTRCVSSLISAPRTSLSSTTMTRPAASLFAWTLPTAPPRPAPGAILVSVRP